METLREGRIQLFEHAVHLQGRERHRRTGRDDPLAEPYPHRLRPVLRRLVSFAQMDVQSQCVGEPQRREQLRQIRQNGLRQAARRSIALRHGQIPPGQRAELCRGPARRELRTAPHPADSRFFRRIRPLAASGPGRQSFGRAQLPLPVAQRPLFPARRQRFAAVRTGFHL